ncbi:uncharacterized, partial [Tachysurus ichikawai]
SRLENASVGYQGHGNAEMPRSGLREGWGPSGSGKRAGSRAANALVKLINVPLLALVSDGGDVPRSRLRSVLLGKSPRCELLRLGRSSDAPQISVSSF